MSKQRISKEKATQLGRRSTTQRSRQTVGLMSTRRVFNAPATAGPVGSASGSAEQLGLELQRCMLSLKGQYLAEDGRGVDYQLLRDSVEFKEYCGIAVKLNSVRLNGQSEIERKSVFISILIIHAQLLYGVQGVDRVWFP